MFSTQLALAIRKYEEIREKVYEEFKITFIQEKVKRKLLNQTNQCIDLLFFEQKNNLGSPTYTLESDNEDKLASEESSILELKELIPKHKDSELKSNKLSKYLDLEAEFSGEEDDENEADEELAEIIDNNVDDGINLDYFVEEREKRNKEILSKLESRFMSKNKNRKVKTFETLNSDSQESFPEFESFEFENLKEDFDNKVKSIKPIGSETMVFKKPEIEDSFLFNNEGNAAQKLLKKDEAKSKGFFERM